MKKTEQSDQTEQIAEKAEQAAEKTERRFTKAQLLRSARYSARRDALSAILQDDMRYTHKEVAARLKKFMKKKVD